MLSVIREPADNEVSFETIGGPNLDNRTGIPIDANVESELLHCSANRSNKAISSIPVVSWIRDGVLISNSTGFNSSLSITRFAVTDAGFYQCIFMDTDNSSRSEIVTTIPYRLDTGELMLTLKELSLTTNF